MDRLRLEEIDNDHLDPSDIIDRCEDSDASEVSRSGSIHDLDAMVNRLLRNKSSASEESDNDDTVKKSERDHNVIPEVHFDGPEASNMTDELDRNVKGGSTRLPLLNTTHLAPYPIHRLQSSESLRYLQGGSAQDSRRSSLASQLSDDVFLIRPLNQELEEADRKEGLQRPTGTTSSDTYTSGSRSSGEESGEEEECESERWPSSEEIEFQLRDEGPAATLDKYDTVTTLEYPPQAYQKQAVDHEIQQLNDLTSSATPITTARLNLNADKISSSNQLIEHKQNTDSNVKYQPHIKRFSPPKKQTLSKNENIGKRTESTHRTVVRTLPRVPLPLHKNTLQDSTDSESDESSEMSSSDSEVFLTDDSKPALSNATPSIAAMEQPLDPSKVDVTTKQSGGKMLPLSPTPGLASKPISMMRRNRPRSATLPTTAANRRAAIEARAGLRPLLPQQMGSTPSLAKVGSPALPLKGILKKSSRFGSTVSTIADAPPVAREIDSMSSNSSSKSDISDQPGSSISLPAESPGRSKDKWPKLQQLGGVWSSTSSSEDGDDLEKTLTNETLHTRNPPLGNSVLSTNKPLHSNGNNQPYKPLIPAEDSMVKRSHKASTFPGKKAPTGSPIVTNRHPLEQCMFSQTPSPPVHNRSSQLIPQDRSGKGPTQASLATTTLKPVTNNCEVKDLFTMVKELELEQLQMKKVFLRERKTLWEVIIKQNELLDTFQRKRQQDQARLTATNKHIRSLKAKIEDLEGCTMHLSRQFFAQLTTQDHEQGSVATNKMGPLVSGKKLAKLTKFFGDTPPILRQFLEKLGYEEHIGRFESAGIGLPELPYITDRQLRELGIPLGHRTRILQEAQRLTYSSI